MNQGTSPRPQSPDPVDKAPEDLPPETLAQAGLRVAWQLKPSHRLTVLLTAALVMLAYVVWQSLPEDTKKRLLGDSPLNPPISARHQRSESTPVSPNTDAWLIIRGVDLFQQIPNAKVKVKAVVNGTSFTYPTLSGVEWMGVGPTMAPQQFHLPPPGPHGYAIRMEMFTRSLDDNGRETANSVIFKSTETIFVTSVPIDKNYYLYAVNYHFRGPDIEAVVKFSISPDPNAN